MVRYDCIGRLKVSYLPVVVNSAIVGAGHSSEVEPQETLMRHLVTGRQENHVDGVGRRRRQMAERDLEVELVRDVARLEERPGVLIGKIW
jgi:hypothetical protein